MTVKIFAQIEAQHSLSFFKFMVGLYGACEELLPYAVYNMSFLSVFLKELMRMCETECQTVVNLLHIPETYRYNKDTLPPVLDTVAIAISNPTADISEEVATMVFNFLLPVCISCNATNTLVNLLALCAGVKMLHPYIMQSNFWPCILVSMVPKGDAVVAALRLLQILPCEDETVQSELCIRLIDLYRSCPDVVVASAICWALRSVRVSLFPLEELVMLVFNGFFHSDREYFLSAVEIAKCLNSETIRRFCGDAFRCELEERLKSRDADICQAIGQFAVIHIEVMKRDLAFVQLVLMFLSAADPPFRVIVPLIQFCCLASSRVEVMELLSKRHFPEVLERLPWKYGHEQSLKDLMDFVSQNYNGSTE
jgi:hypothetical protein